MKRILFSAVGITDPITGQNDGAILHILRHHDDIDEVYLYCSKEICDYEEKDHRYTYCLDKLKEETGKNFETHIIKREDLVDVHIFDFFLKEFKEIIDGILSKNDCELLLNVSSGTPAMKSALQVLGTVTESVNVTAIQVSTPVKAHNPRREDDEDYDAALQWEFNMDNHGDSINRCEPSGNSNLAAEIKKNIIKKQVAAFDYIAARNIALDMQDFLDEKAVSLLQAMAARIMLDKGKCLAYAKNTGYKILPHQTGNECSIFEALMLGRIKILREEYLDFLRSYSPLFFGILERIVEKQLGVEIRKYYSRKEMINGTMFVQWDENKVTEDDDLVEVLTTKGSYKVPLRRQVVTTAHLVQYIEKKSVDASMKGKIRQLREIEEKIRNPIAHCITYLTDDILKTSIGFSAMDIFNMMKGIMGYAGISVTAEDLQTYENCNKEIMKYL